LVLSGIDFRIVKPQYGLFLVIIATLNPECFFFHKPFLSNSNEKMQARNIIIFKIIKDFFKGLSEEKLNKRVRKNVINKI